MPPRWLNFVLLGLCAAVTTTIAAFPQLRFAYENLPARVVAETVIALIGALVTFLIWGRYRLHHDARDLSTAVAIGLLAVASFFFYVLPVVTSGGTDQGLASWAPLVIRMVGTVILAAGSLMAGTSAARPRRPARWAWLVGSAVAAGGIVLAFAGGIGGDPVSVSLTAAESSRPQLRGAPLVVSVQITSAALLLIAATAYSRRSRLEADRLSGWMSGGCVLLAGSRLNYAMFPALYTQVVFVGDALRLGAYVTFLVGAGHEITRYWNDLARAMVSADRQRMARELHDGLAQELAFIAGASQQMSSTDPAMERVASSALRALDESRRAIFALTDEDATRSDAVIARAAEEAAAMFGVDLALDIDRDDELAALESAHVSRIVREAMVNAVRHGGASRIEVTYRRRPRYLTITDDGAGFEPQHQVAADDQSGFGLTSMRGRADELGAVLRITSSPSGTEVRLSWVDDRGDSPTSTSGG